MKKIMLICFGLIIGLLIGCSSIEVMAEQNYPLKILKQNENGMCSTWNIHDDDTGVEYIVVTTWYSCGTAAGRSCAITPRLNADGTLYIKP